MKRISVLIAAMAVSLVGAMSIGSGAASADVLCKTFSFAEGCGLANKYPAGTKIYSELRAGTHAKLDPWKGSSLHEFDCTHSALVMEITNPGSPSTNVEATITNMTFVSCDNTPTVVTPGNAYITESPAGSNAGSVAVLNNRIDVNSQIFGVKCKVQIEGPGTLVGPAWNGLGASTITFANTKASTNSCGTWYFSGEYILTNPMSVYAAQF